MQDSLSEDARLTVWQGILHVFQHYREKRRYRIFAYHTECQRNTKQTRKPEKTAVKPAHVKRERFYGGFFVSR